MPRPVLFEPLNVADMSLRNRIVIAPMGQYSAIDGNMTDWHLIHLGQLALSGAALLTVEATAVLPEGRISYADVGLWNDDNEGPTTKISKNLTMAMVLRSTFYLKVYTLLIHLCTWLQNNLFTIQF